MHNASKSGKIAKLMTINTSEIKNLDLQREFIVTVGNKLIGRKIEL